MDEKIEVAEVESGEGDEELEIDGTELKTGDKILIQSPDGERRRHEVFEIEYDGSFSCQPCEPSGEVTENDGVEIQNC